MDTNPTQHQHNTKGAVKLGKVFVDLGRYATYAMREPMAPWVEIPSLVAFSEGGFKAPVEAAGKYGWLHLRVNGVELLAGSLAGMQRRRDAASDLSRDKANEVNNALMAAALGLLAMQGEEIELHTNCPLLDWRPLSRRLAEAFVGEYTVEFLMGRRVGTPNEKVRFRVAHARTWPEGVLAHYGLNYDQVEANKYGKPAFRRTDLVKGKTVYLDIGAATMNLVTFEDNVYIDDESNTFYDLGLRQLHEEMLAELQAKYINLNLTLHRLEEILRRPEPSERMHVHGTQQIQLGSMQSAYYARHAAKIREQLQKSLHGAPNHIVPVGGGGLAMAEHLRAVYANEQPAIPVVWDETLGPYLTMLGLRIMSLM